MSALLKYELAATWVSCFSCGVLFGITGEHEDLLRRTHRSFYCPNGHTQYFPGKSDAQKVREEMQAKLDEANRLAEFRRAEAATARKAELAAKAKLKKQTKRVEAGVCIHCNRTFKQLAAHMRCKHGELAK